MPRTEQRESVWISGPDYRRRCGGMPNSTFYDRLARGQLPPARYPFGSAKPYWYMPEVLEHEAHALQVPPMHCGLKAAVDPCNGGRLGGRDAA